MWNCAAFWEGGGKERKSRERTKPSRSLLSVERLINEVLGTHHYLLRFTEKKKKDRNKIFSRPGPRVSQWHQFLLGGSFFFLGFLYHSLDNPCDILVDWSFISLLHCLTFHVLCFSDLDEKHPDSRTIFHISSRLFLILSPCSCTWWTAGPRDQWYSLFILFPQQSAQRVTSSYWPMWGECWWTWGRGRLLYRTLCGL